MAQPAKNLPAMQETQETWVQVQSLGWEDPLENKMATHSSIFAWKFPRTEEPGGLQSMGSRRVGPDWAHKRNLIYPYSDSPSCPSNGQGLIQSHSTFNYHVFLVSFTLEQPPTHCVCVCVSVLFITWMFKKLFICLCRVLDEACGI